MSFDVVGFALRLERSRRERLAEELNTTVRIVGRGAMGGNAAARHDELDDEPKVPLVLGRMAQQMYQAALAAGNSQKYHAVVVTGVKIRAEA